MHLDSVIFILFLLINLFVGIRAIKYSNILDRRFTTPHITAAILTITYGGEVLCNRLDITGLLRLAGGTISYFIIGSLLAHRLHLFLNNRSVAEIMGRLYGGIVQKIVAICGILHSAAVAAVQFKILSMAITWFFAIQPAYSLLIAALVVMFGVGSNHIQPLALIRVVRCASFGILLPITAWNLWKCVAIQSNGDQAHIALAIKTSWNSLTHLHAPPLDYIIYFIIFSIPAFYPAQVDRILISEHATQIKRSFNGAGFFSLSINLLLLWVALLIQKNSDELVVSAIPFGYLHLKGLFMISVAALTISTAGANLHAATVLITNDLPNLFKWVKHSFVYQIIVGAIAALLALYTQDQWIWMALILFKAVVSLPLLLALMGISLHPYGVLIGMVTGGLTTIAWLWFIPNGGINSLLPAILMNLFSIVVIQFFKRKSMPDPYCLANNLVQEAVPKPPPLWKQCAHITFQRLHTFNLLDYLEKQLPKDSLPYIIFSFYILLTGYGSFYTFFTNPIWHTRLEICVLLPSLFVATFFLVYTFTAPQSYIRKIASVVWPLSHIYFFFLVGTGMAMLNTLTYFHAIIFILNLFLSIFITPFVMIWFGVIVGAIVGVIMVWILPHYMDSNIRWIDCCLGLNINIAYALFMLFVLVGGYLYHNNGLNKLLAIIQALTSEKEEQNARQFFNKQQVEALAYESSYIICQLNDQLIRLEQPDQHLVTHSEQTIRLNKYFDSIFQHLKHNLHLVTNWISIDQLLAESFDAIKIGNIYDAPYVVMNTKHLYIQCAIESIKHLIISSLQSCSVHASLRNQQKKDIYIHIDDTQLGYRLTLLQGKLQKINAISFVITTSIRLPTIRPTYKVAEMGDIQLLGQSEAKIDLENQHIVHAHYGYYERFSSESEITHLYVIPVNVKEITKAFATLSPVVYTQKMVLDPISMQEERVFVEKVKRIKRLNVHAIMDALQLIKVYYTTQRRKTGELFYLHPMAVASILLTLTEDSKVIIAGLVHDVVQNTPLTAAGLTTLFGSSIAQLVSAAARLEKELPNQKEDYTAYIEAVIADKRHDVLLVRLADVLHNARTISGHTVEKQIEKARLIQRFYLPLAIQLELVDIAHELHVHTEQVLNVAMGKD